MSLEKQHQAVIGNAELLKGQILALVEVRNAAITVLNEHIIENDRRISSPAFVKLHEALKALEVL